MSDHPHRFKVKSDGHGGPVLSGRGDGARLRKLKVQLIEEIAPRVAECRGLVERMLRERLEPWLKRVIPAEVESILNGIVVELIEKRIQIDCEPADEPELEAAGGPWSAFEFDSDGPADHALERWFANVSRVELEGPHLEIPTDWDAEIRRVCIEKLAANGKE